MVQLKFDPSINAGHILTFCGFIAAGTAAYYGARIELSIVDQRLKAVEGQITKMADVLVQDARQDMRIISLEKRMNRVETCRARIEGEGR